MNGATERRILVVDDDTVLRRRLARAFVDRGYSVGEASCGSEARKHMTDSRPDLAVLDLKLGEESGLELLKELRGIHSGLRAVILTGYGTIGTAVDAVKSGAVHYLTKPVDADTVLSAFGESAPTEEVETPELAQVEWDYINRVMDDCGGNITKASKVLGLHRRSLQRKLAKNPRNLR